jgi:hypothetical protein
MQPDTMRTLAEYIHELRSRDWYHNGASEQPAFDTTTEDDAHWDQGDSSGDAGRGKNHSG